ncbi:hypothetical protein AB0P16_04835 [Dietzia maris]|uniref:hypothetical protein n=1 Tax=Dietzia maris TaxID=37915 RepID=UPI00341FEFD5
MTPPRASQAVEPGGRLVPTASERPSVGHRVDSTELPAVDRPSTSTLSTTSGTSSDLRVDTPDDNAPTLALTEVNTSQEALSAQARASYSYVALGLLLIPTLLGYVRYWMPELRGIPFLDQVVSQLAPAMGRELFRFGPVSQWQTDHSSWLVSITVLGALVSFGILTHQKSEVRHFGVFAAGFTAVVGLLATIAALVSGAAGPGLIGVLLLALSTAISGLLTYRCLEGEPNPANAAFPMSPPEVIALVGFTILPAISLGRAVAGEANRDAAARLSSDAFEYLWSLMLLPIFSQLLLGAAILGVVFLVTSLIWFGKKKNVSTIPGVVIVVIVIGVIVVALLPWAGTMSDKASYSLTNVPRDAAVSEQCARWSRGSGASIAVAGPGCREIRTYDGHVRTATSDLGFSATTPSGEWLSTTGTWADKGTVTGVYGDTLVVAGARLPYYHSPVRLKGVDYHTGTEKWAYECGNAEPFLLTLSGSAGGDDPGKARITVPGAGESVIVDCRHVITYLDPQTGRPR